MSLRVHYCDWRDEMMAERLSGHDAVVCTASLLTAVPETEDAFASLSAAERIRYAGYMNAIVARRYACGRHVLREVLGRVLRCPAAQVPLREGLHGKPFLAAGTARSVWFSLSHSEELLVIAMSRSADVGVDVERAREFEQWPRIADRVLDPAERRELESAIARGEDPSRAFLRQWCRVEAELKAIGCGIAGLEEHLAGARPAGLRRADLSGLPLPPDLAESGVRFQAALALCTPGARMASQARSAANDAASPTARPARASTA